MKSAATESSRRLYFKGSFHRPVVPSRAILLPGTLGDVWRHFGCYDLGEGAPGQGWVEPGILLNVPQGTGRSPQQRIIQSRRPTVPRLKNPAIVPLRPTLKYCSDGKKLMTSVLKELPL